MMTWWKKIVCWLLGHIPETHTLIDHLVTCERCNEVLGQKAPDAH